MADPGDKKKPATYQDVLDAPEHMIAEIISGELRLSPRPGGPHTLVASQLGYELGPPFHTGENGPGGWILLLEPELHLGDQIVVPDWAGWHVDRLDRAELDAPFFKTPPDWICEVMSRRTEHSDRLMKMGIYAAAGVGHVWLIHPMYSSLEVFRLHEGKWLLLAGHIGHKTVRAEPFEAIELDVSRLWRHILPPGSRASEAPGGYEYEEY